MPPWACRLVACDLGRGPRWRGGRAERRARARRARLRRHRVRGARRVRRQGALDAGAGIGDRRARRPARRARLPVLPRLLPSPAGHDGAHPARRPAPSPTTSSPRRAILLAQAGGRNELVTAAHAPASLDDLAVVEPLRVAVRAASVGIPPQELALFVERLLTLLTSCDERRFEQWEHAELVGLRRRRAAHARRSRSSSPTG